jgi:ParB family chromosome partitioning protein
MTTETAPAASKKAFDLARNSIYVASPDELCIIGGRAMPEAEQGPLDTGHGRGEHELWDARILDAMTPEEVANIDAYGVMEPIIIAKANGVPTVVDGRGRVRRARLANKLRAARGEPPITIDCKVLRSSGNRLLGAMISLNEVRRADTIEVKIEKLQQLLDRGVSVEDAATIFGAKVETVKGWLAYGDNATDDLKQAVATGELSSTAAAEVARVKDPVKQKAALDKLKAAPKKTVGEARKAVAATTRTAAGDGVGLTGKREQRALLNEVAAMKPSEVGKGDDGFWDGVEAALVLVTGHGEPDKRIRKLLKKLGWSAE